MFRLDATLSRAAVAAVAILGGSSPASAQQYPSRPVKIIVAYTPGGANDLIARFVAQRLTPTLGQQVIVENKPGANGTIGFEAGMRSPPDGYTLTLLSSAYTVHPSLYRLKFDPVSDITPIIQISQGPLLVVVHPALPVKTAQDLIALAKSKPGKLNYASPGQGGTIHLATELFAGMTGIKLNHVPYKGTSPALIDTISGQTDLYFSSTAPALPHVRSGRLRAIAVTGSQRIPAAPEVPTVAESALPGYEAVLWHGLAGPKGLPRSIVDRINSEVTTVLKSKEAAQQFQNDGVAPAGGTPEQFLATIRKEIEVWRKVVSEAGVTLE